MKGDECPACEGRGKWLDSFTTFQGVYAENVPVTCASCEGSGIDDGWVKA